MLYGMSRNKALSDPNCEVIAGVAVSRMPVNSEGQPICGALKKDEKPCQQSAGAGTDHPGFGTCKWHTGAVPSSKVGAARQEIIQYVDRVKALGRYEMGPPPDEVMLQEVARAKASVEWLDERLKDMTSDGDGPLEGEQAIVVATSVGFNKLMYQWTEQRRLLQQITSMVVRAGIAKRQVEIHEMQAAAVLTAVLAVIGSPELALQPQQVDFAKRMIASNLRDLATGPDQRAAMMEIAGV